MASTFFRERIMFRILSTMDGMHNAPDELPMRPAAGRRGIGFCYASTPYINFQQKPWQQQRSAQSLRLDWDIPIHRWIRAVRRDHEDYSESRPVKYLCSTIDTIVWYGIPSSNAFLFKFLKSLSEILIFIRLFFFTVASAYSRACFLILNKGYDV